ncbi:MAG: flagellar hook-associated protein FlgL [Desulfobacteraceae bacterium]|nr:flagellar hook-associated protein FlgL [Desulfobacteraceae bacterium]MCB9494995.1 flagellar hook-associated protein FlgL [Desulfobacteraceae bacterium]
MRIASRTIFELQKNQLGGLYKRLAEDNTTVSTGKRINRLADDPVGLTQVLNFKSGTKFLSQLNTNIENGRTWLRAVETAMDSTEDLTLEMKTLALKMKNDSVNADQRVDAINQVNAALAELINLGNTQIKGEYIFSGNKTNIQPVVADNLKDPQSIKYNGDEFRYQVKISQEDTMEVGQRGSKIFWDEQVVVDSTNNSIDFREVIRGGFKIGDVKAGEMLEDEQVNIEVKDYEALDKGTPDLKPLQFVWDKDDNLWRVNNDPGYDLPETIEGTEDAFDVDLDKDGSADIEVRLTQAAEHDEYVEFSLVPHDIELKAEIPDGTYTRDSLAQAVGNALTKASEENGYKLEYNAEYNEETKQYSITYNENSYDGYIKTDFLWKTGENSGTSIGPDIGFEVSDTSFEPAISDNRLGKIIELGVNDTMSFSVDGGTTVHNITIGPGKYSNEELAQEIENQMKLAVGSLDFEENFEVKFNNKDVRFEFDATETSPGSVDLELYWNSGPQDLGTTLGFPVYTDDTGSLEYKGLSFAPKAEIEEGVNDTIDFSVDAVNYSVTIPPGDYSLDELALEIKTAMILETGNENFDVTFDSGSGEINFDASGTGAAAFDLLWSSGASSSRSASETLGFDSTADSTGALDYSGTDLPLGVEIIAGVNDRVNFRELPQNGDFSPELSFTIKPGHYSGDELAEFMEFQMEQASSAEGYNIDYTVSYDSVTHQYKFRENGTELNEIEFLWNSGEDRPVSEGGTGRSAAVTLGFDENEDHSAILTNTSDEETSWGLFDTLIDFKKYLENNDVDGLNRTLTRLDYHYDQQLSKVTEIGMKESRLITKQSVISNLSFRYEENRSEIEEADIVKAISDLTASETAYQAALSSSAKVMKLSLADYL